MENLFLFYMFMYKYLCFFCFSLFCFAFLFPLNSISMKRIHCKVLIFRIEKAKSHFDFDELWNVIIIHTVRSLNWTVLKFMHDEMSCLDNSDSYMHIWFIPYAIYAISKISCLPTNTNNDKHHQFHKGYSILKRNQMK